MASSTQQKFQFLREREERSILAKIKFKLYEISTEVLLEVLSTCGNIETVKKFRSGEEFHLRVCFQDKDSATKALNWYNGRCIYDLWCKLELFQGFQVTDRSRKPEVPGQETKEVEVASEIPTLPKIDKRQNKIKEIPIEDDDTQLIWNSPRCFDHKLKVFSEIVLGALRVEANGENVVDLARTEGIADLEFSMSLESVLGNSGAKWINDDVVESSTTIEIAKPIEDVYQEIDEIAKDRRFPIQCESSRAEGLFQPSNQENEDSLEDLHIVSDSSEVNLEPSKVMNSDNAPNELAEFVNLLI